MDGKSMRNLGIVGGIIGVAILIFGLSKYNYANTMYKTASWFGENDSSRRWSSYLDNYKIFIIVGAIIFTISFILIIAGLVNSKNKNSVISNKTSNTASVSEKIGELKKMLDNGLITMEEFESKKKQIIDKM